MPRTKRYRSSRKIADELMPLIWSLRLGAHKQSLGPDQCQPPAFVLNLEAQLRGLRPEAAQENGAVAVQNQVAYAQLPDPDVYPTPEELDAIFELDFPNIDWSFWSSID